MRGGSLLRRGPRAITSSRGARMGCIDTLLPVKGSGLWGSPNGGLPGLEPLP